MANKQKERYSIWLNIREMPIKPKVRNHCTISRMTVSKKTDNANELQAWGVGDTPIHQNGGIYCFKLFVNLFGSF